MEQVRLSIAILVRSRCRVPPFRIPFHLLMKMATMAVLSTVQTHHSWSKTASFATCFPGHEPDGAESSEAVLVVRIQ